MKKSENSLKMINFNIFWLLYILCSMVISLLSLGVTYLLEIFSKIAIDHQYDLIGRAVAALIIFMTAGLGIRYLYLLFRKKALFSWNYYIKINLMKNILSRSSKNFKAKDRSYYVSLFNNDIMFIENNYISPIVTIIQEVFVFIVGAVYSFSINYVFTLIILAAGVLSALFTIKLSSLASRDNKVYMDKMGQYNETIDDSLRGFSLLYKSNAVLNFMSIFKVKTVDAEQAHVKAGFTSGMMGSLINHFSGVIQLVLMLISALMVVNGSMDVVYFPVMLSLMNILIYPMYTVMTQFGQLKSSKAVVQNMKREINVESEKLWEDEASLENKEIVGAGIKIEDMSFAYGDKMIFDHVSLDITDKTHILLRGDSGAGKSTLLKLFTREYIPDQGEMYIGNRRIDNMSRTALFQYISLISQHPMIFRDTILQNIVMFESEDKINMEKVMSAVCGAGLEDFVGRLKDGLNTVLTDSGDNLSGGEKQRIEVARAIYRDTPIVLIDEATSGLDLGKATELENIFRKMDKLIISTSHRQDIDLSELYDQILVIKDHKILYNQTKII